MPSSAMTVAESSFCDDRKRLICKPRKNPLNASLGAAEERPYSRSQSLPYVPSAFLAPMDESNLTSARSRTEMPPFSIARDAGIDNDTDGRADGYYSEKNGNRTLPSDPARARVRQVAPSRICCVIKDVYYLAKISESARRLGVRVEFVNGERDLLAELADMPEAARPSLIVVDLNNTSARPLTLISHLRARLKKSASIIGYVSCVQGDLKV
ncbi:MAG TPA: hypothetical protein VE866_12805, partial [Candidatus Binatia bacterium]|nr:hypothetical protein [Candidatus Binatia bacterium]